MSIFWLARITGHRARSDHRLLLVVSAVAVVSCTMITSLALLVTVAEQAGIRSALGAESADRTGIEVRVSDPTVPVAGVAGSAASAVDFVLAGAVPSESEVYARTSFATVDGLVDEKPVLAYFGELPGIDSAATIVDGEWPTGPSSPSSTVAVAIPDTAADAFGLAVGDEFATDGRATEIVGVYRIGDAADRYWSPDPLGGAGLEQDFPLPRASVYIPTDAFGPLVVAPRGLDDAELVVDSVDIRFAPDFSGLRVEDLGLLAERLDEARTRVPVRVGPVAGSVLYSSDLSRSVDETASGLLVTRSTVITVGLLLLLVTVVALVQSASLVTASRADERRLLRARGASPTGIRGMTVIEAAVIGVLVAAVGPPLATLVYRVVAAHPAAVAAGMPAESGLPPLTWIVAVATAVVFAGVLVAPLIRTAELYDDERGEQRAARRIRPLGLVRLGIDVGIAGVAFVLYRQLVDYRPPAGEVSVRVDPLLVVTPALVVAACALLAVRLVPVLATVLERAGARSRGAVLSLASWEVGRRARSATAVVLLLTLSLAVGSYGATFLSTWRQSQVDQAELAFGAPARVPALPDAIAAQSVDLAEGAVGLPQPVLRRQGQVAGPSAAGSGTLPPSGPSAQILGLTAAARGFLDRGRVGEEGGAAVERMLRSEAPASEPIALPDSVAGLAATVRIGEPDAPFGGVVATVSAVVEGDGGVLSAVALGTVPVDGLDHAVQGVFPGADEDAPTEAAADGPGGAAADAADRRASGLVGIVVDFTVGDPDQFRLRDLSTPAIVLVRDIAALSSVTGSTAEPVIGEALSVEDASRWVPRAPTRYEPRPTIVDPPDGWQLALGVVIPADVDGRRATFSLTGWEDPVSVPVVVSAGLAQQMALRPGVSPILVVDGAQIVTELVGTVPVIPGSASSPGIPSSSGAEPADAASAAVVVDQVLLSRALIVAGSEGAVIDEWWVDVAPGGGRAYVDLHATGDAAADAESSEVLATEQTEGPLRIALPAAVSLVIVAAGLLAVVGFAVHTAAAMRARRTELAQLRAIGLARRTLLSVIGAESVLLSVLGTVFGIAVGVLLGSAVSPLIGLSPDGSAPLPSVTVVVPAAVIGALAGLVAVAVVVVVLAVAGRQRSADPAAILRGGAE